MNKPIDSEVFSVSGLFNSFYDVPDYQREYVWGETEDSDDASFSFSEDPVYRLLDDVYNASPLYGKYEEKDEYFLGAIIVCESPDDEDGIVRWHLIDGQQRVTTLFIILLALRDLFNVYDEEKGPPDSLRSLIFEAKANDSGQDVKRLKLALQYEDAECVLENIYNGEVDNISLNAGSSRRIFNSYKKAKHYLKLHCDNYQKLQQYFGFLQGKVKLVRIETPSVHRALEIFETINERGVGLSPLDLLKNLMFINSSKQDFDKLKADWKKLTELIAISEPTKPMRFLRYFYNADYSNKKDGIVREKDIYKNFKRNSSRIGYENNPTQFVQKLIIAAEAYNNMRSGKNPSGKNVESLQNLIHLGRSTFRQHYSLLLSARHLKSLYGEFADIVERLVAVSYFAGVQPNVQERNFADLTIEARKIKNAEGLQKFKSLAEEKMIAPILDDFAYKFMHISTENLVGYRLKYLLGRLSQFIEQEMYGIEGRGDLREFLPRTNNIEHILPKDGKKAAYAEFLSLKKHDISAENIEELQEEYVPMLGNLTLLLEDTNKSAGGNKYSKKSIENYLGDKWAISKFMREKPKNTKKGKAVRAFNKHLTLFPKWDAVAVEKRQAMYTKIAHKMWDLPEPKIKLNWEESTE